MQWFPPDLAWPALILLLSAGFLAGFVDAVVGGGGLIQIPALFALFPTTAPAILLGTNKVSGIFGTSAAAIQYARRVPIEWNAGLPAALSALVFAFCGAWTVSIVRPDFLRAALPFILGLVAIYTFCKKDLGEIHRPIHRGGRERLIAASLGAVIGFYDGFFGPGTGSFLVFAFVQGLGFEFLSAAAAAKVVNVACNLAALAWFGWSGQWWLGLGLLMAICNVAGSLIGTRLAIQRGSVFVRHMFLVVVILLVIKISYDRWLR